MDVLRKSHAEDCFFRRKVFFEAVYPLISSMSLMEMSTAPSAYPVEEYLLST